MLRTSLSSRSWPAIALPIAIVACTSGLWWHPTWWGNEDWDLFAHHLEAVRRTILEYHQIPWWNPWSGGGMPLAANPLIGLFSLNVPLVLAFGVYPGLKLALLAYWFIAAEGARRLASLWLRDPLACAFVGFVYVVNGGVVMHAAAGHLPIELLAWIPWAIAYAFRLERDWRTGWRLGAVLAMAVLTSFWYLLTYLALVLSILLVWRFAKGNGAARRRIAAGCAVAAAVVLALGGMSIALAAAFISDFPRKSTAIIPQRFDLPTVMTMFLRPGQDLAFRPAAWRGTPRLGWHEYGCYLGVPVCFLVLASLTRGWRWWHTLALMALWLAFGNVDWYVPSTWLTHVPVLSGLRVPSRWRVVGALGIALAAGAAVDAGRRSSRPGWRVAASVAAALAVVDLGLNASLAYRSAFWSPPETISRRAPGTDFVQTPLAPAVPRRHAALLLALHAHEGVIFAYEPWTGSHRTPTARLWWGAPGYRGEYWSSAGPVRLIRWSPNALTLEAPPDADVEINQNPGSYWVQAGRRVFPELGSVDRHQPFRVRADGRGLVELTVWPSAWSHGLWMTGVGVCGLAFGVACARLRRTTP